MRPVAGAIVTANRSVPDYVRRIRSILGGDELLQIPSVSISLRDAGGRVLLARHAEGDVWLLPDGAIEPGEVPADAAVREMFEDPGLLVRLTELVGVFGGPEFVVEYRNQHRTSYVMAVFGAELDTGTAQPDGVELRALAAVLEQAARESEAHMATSVTIPERSG